MKKDKIIYLIGIIVMLISTMMSVYAASYLYNANEVSYNNTSSGISSDNVQGAIDSLYTAASNYNSLNSRVTSLEAYAYETGSSGEWTWKKYNDGTLDMWRYGSTTASNYTTWNSMYGYTLTLTYPTAIKPTSTDYVKASATIGTGHAIDARLQDNTSGITAYWLASAKDSQTITYMVYVHGNWK